jgi:hypothetical protein
MAIIPEDYLNKHASNQEKLNHTAAALRTLTPTLPRFNREGKQDGETSIAAEAAWQFAHFSRVFAELAAVRESLAQIAKNTGQPLDVAAIEAAAERGAQKAMEGVLTVDVNINKPEPAEAPTPDEAA